MLSVKNLGQAVRPFIGSFHRMGQPTATERRAGVDRLEGRAVGVAAEWARGFTVHASGLGVDVAAAWCVDATELLPFRWLAWCHLNQTHKRSECWWVEHKLFG